jgi:phosphatidylinositol alpha-1,6-mannosyltransferase
MPTLVISEMFPPRVGGSGRWLWELYRRLPRQEYILAVGQDPRQGAFDRTHDLRLARAPLTLSELGICSFRGLGGYRRALGAVRRIAAGRGIERVHAGRCVPEGWIALFLRWRYDLPYLCYVHGEEVKLGAGAGTMASRQLRWMTWAVLRGAELVIANSRNSARILRDEWRLPAERIRLLHPGVDTERFVPAARDGEVRARLGWEDRRVVLTAGRLQKRKGHDRMIVALGEVREAIPNVLYAIVGHGEERPSLESLVTREGLGDYVQFLGELDDRMLIACYQQCDLFVLPNRQVGRDIEGFGIVLLEAQACGKPVVAGASGGTAETMRIPETGRIVACDDHRELAALISELLADRDRLHRMGEAARRHAVEQFDWTGLTDQAQSIFAWPIDGATRPNRGTMPSSPQER